MNVSRRFALAALVIGVAAAAVAYVAVDRMGIFDSEERQLRRLLTPAAQRLADNAHIASYAPNPDFKPQTFYLVRDLDEREFRSLAQELGLTVTPSPAIVDAVWLLPKDVQLRGWGAPAVPAGAGLDARGNVGSSALNVRWYQGKAFIVLTAVE